MDKINLIAYHGWGFDRSCWHSWQRLAAQRGWRFAAADRGYGGHPHVPATPEEGVTILLTHSYGLYHCPVDQLQRARGLVIFGGFRDFHPTAERGRRRSQRVLTEMVHQFGQTPERVLQQFYVNCDAPDSVQPFPTMAMNAALLHHDLQALAVSRLDLTRLAALEWVLVFHGTADRIVPPAQGRDLAIALQDQPSAKHRPTVHYIEVAGAGHALPFTHLSQCCSWMAHD